MNTRLSLAAATLLALTPAANAAMLMLDFGPTSVGTATANSPYHTINPSAGTTWNTSLGTADSSGTLLYADGSNATGVSYNLGTGTGTTSVLTTNPGSSSALGTGINTGLYGGSTSVGRDAVFGTGSLTMQISGLAAGTYDIYYVGRNTNRGVADNYTQNLFAATSASSGNFNWSGYSSNTITYGSAASNTNITSWVQGQNYAKVSVTVASGEVLNLAFTGTGIETRGFLNSLQVVSVPEPSVTLLLAVAGTFLAVARRRRHS